MPYLFKHFDHSIKLAHGSPLNLGVIGHFDGWQPFGTSYKGSGSLEIQNPFDIENESRSTVRK